MWYFPHTGVLRQVGADDGNVDLFGTLSLHNLLGQECVSLDEHIGGCRMLISYLAALVTEISVAGHILINSVIVFVNIIWIGIVVGGENMFIDDFPAKKTSGVNNCA